MDKPVNDIWIMIKKTIPAPIIIIVSLYIGVMFLGLKAYDSLAPSESMKETLEYLQKIQVTSEESSDELQKVLNNLEEYLSDSIKTSKFYNTFFKYSPIALLVGILFYIIIYLKKNKKTGLAKGTIDALIVEQNARSRDDQFNRVNASVKKTYWVLGVSLTSILQNETALRKMADNSVKIKMCMMNYEIAVDNICSSSFANNACVLAGKVDEIKNSKSDKEKIKDILNKASESLLQKYNIVIDDSHFNAYYNTDTDYKGIIQNSYTNLKRIKKSINTKYGGESFQLRVSNSFIPISMTITDAESEDGKMVVEFHLPFKNRKVLFAIDKSDNPELFNIFVDFYNTVWGNSVE